MIFVAYILVGACAAAFRAYLDPILIAEGALSASSLYPGKSLFWKEAVFIHFLFWPIALPFDAIISMAADCQRRGVAEVARREKAKEAEAAREREIDRIIKEHAL